MIYVNYCRSNLYYAGINTTLIPSLNFYLFELLYFSGPSGSLMPALLSVQNRVPLKPMIGGVRDVALIHYPSCTDSIKPSLQYSCNFVAINASRFLFSITFLNLERTQQNKITLFLYLMHCT
jgi:hypothetical protein